MISISPILFSFHSSKNPRRYIPEFGQSGPKLQTTPVSTKSPTFNTILTSWPSSANTSRHIRDITNDQPMCVLFLRRDPNGLSSRPGRVENSCRVHTKMRDSISINVSQSILICGILVDVSGSSHQHLSSFNFRITHVTKP